MNIEEELGQYLKNGIKKHESLMLYSSWQVGGPADFYLCPADCFELIKIVHYCAEYRMPLYVMGNGTNLLVLDGGVRGFVVNIGKAFDYINWLDEEIVVGAGTSMTSLARQACQKGLVGLEFAAGIPGTLGGAIMMNAGAFGGNIGEKVESVTVVHYDGTVYSYSRGELIFGYRSCNLNEKGIVIEVRLKLEKGDAAESLKSMDNIIKERSRRHPTQPSAGSVFRNLPDNPAGYLIESAGGKGLRIGGAEVSRQHANFIVNTGNATAADILALIQAVQQLVKEKHNLDLQPEVKIIGEGING